MPSAERSTFSIKELAIRILLPMLAGGAIVAVAYYMSARDEDDRPPIIVSNGSIEIQEVEAGDDSTTSGGKGTLETPGPVNGRSIWSHKHPKDQPKRLHALVEGADAAMMNNCPAVYFAQDITAATIIYSTNDGQRDVIVSKEPGNRPVDISVQDTAAVNQSNGTHTLTLDPATDAKLVSVTLAWGNLSTSVTCQFGGAPAPRIVFLQTTK